MCSHVTTDYFIDARDAREVAEPFTLGATVWTTFSHYKNTDKKRFVLGTEYLEQKHTRLSSVDDVWHGWMCNRDMDARETSSGAPHPAFAFQHPKIFSNCRSYRSPSAPEIVFVQFLRRFCGGISSVSNEHSAVTQ